MVNALPPVDGVVVRSTKKSLLKPTSFAKTVNDLSMADKNAIMAESYEPYHGLDVYQYIEFVAHEDAAHDSVERYLQDKESCEIGDGAACDRVRQNDEEVAVINSNATGGRVPNSSNFGAETSSGVTGAPLPNSASVDAAYCSIRHPHYSAGQKLPLGMPIDLDLLQSQGATGRDLSIIRNTRAGLMADAYYCRRRLAFLRSEAACSSTANRPHPGVDVGMGRFFYQTPVFATADGVVESARWETPSSGLLIRVRHENGFVTQYMHMDKAFVSQGQRVSAGCAIGLLGESGGNAEVARSPNAHMGPDLAHLHYDIVYNGSATSVTAPNGREIAIQRGVSNCNCGDFQQKIKPNDFMTYYENRR